MIFLKCTLIFNGFYCFCLLVNKHFTCIRNHISESEKCYNAKLVLYYCFTRRRIYCNIFISALLYLQRPLDKIRNFAFINEENLIKIYQIKNQFSSTHLNYFLTHHLIETNYFRAKRIFSLLEEHSF